MAAQFSIPQGVYAMTPKIRVWSRDQAGYAKVRRIGFALAPEFGGKIHGYCGDTLDAGLLDLLEWHRKPTMDDMHKAYVGKSRTRMADHTLIVQPYSSHLFKPLVCRHYAPPPAHGHTFASGLPVLNTLCLILAGILYFLYLLSPNFQSGHCRFFTE